MIGLIDHGLIEAARHAIARSPHWPRVEHAFRAAHPHCAACPPDAPPHSVSVHHKWPFHIVVALGRADLELDPANLISLCETTHLLKAENHHELLGHLADFKSYNPDVTEDAGTRFHGMTNQAIRNDPRWIAKEHARALDQLSDDDKARIRAILDETFPLAVRQLAA
jgi:hypothetical protein